MSKKNLLLSAILFCACLFGLSKQAHAATIPVDGGPTNASSTSPVPNSSYWNPPSTSYPGGNNLNGDSTPYYDVGNVPGVYDKSVAQIKILAKSGSTFDITVDNAGAGCNSAPINAGLRGPDYSQNNNTGGPNTIFSITDGTGKVVYGPYLETAANGCADLPFKNVDPNKGTSLPNGPAGNYGYDKYFWVVAQAPSAQATQGENSFRVVSSNSSFIVSIGNTLTGYGYRDQNLNNGNYWTSDVIFSVNQDCNTLNQTQAGIVKYYDADATTPGWNPNIQFELQREPWGDQNNWQTLITRGTAYLAANPSGVLFSSNFSSDYKYRVVLQNIGVRNTIFISIQDQGSGPGLSQLAARYHWDPSTCGGQPSLQASCTANGVVNLKLANSATVNWKFTNTGSTTWTPTDSPLTQYRRYVNGAAQSPTTIPSNVAPGGSFTITVSETAPATGSKVIKYTMWQSGVGAFGSPCTTTISGCTGSCGQPPGTGQIKAACDYITISGVTSNATTTFSGASKTITRVPAAIRVTADDGTTYTWLVNNGAGTYGISNLANGGNGTNTGSFTIPTFQIPGINFAMFPHQSYTVQLALEGVDSPPPTSATYQDNGWWNPTNDANAAGYYYGVTFVDTEITPSDCLTAACGGTTAVDAEPGQSAQNLSAGMQFTNKSTVSYSANNPNGYQMQLNTSGGITNVNNVRYGTIVPGTNTTNVTFNAEVDYTGSYSVSLLFKGSELDLGQVSDPCPAQTIVPKTRAFINVTGGDLLAGGGFDQGLSNCTSSPYYVSPKTSTAPPSQTDYSGGIAAYGSAAKGLGSKAEFGVLSLGYNMGNINGPIGLFSVDKIGSNSAILSNQTAQNGGLLNRAGSATPWHCATDYYGTTQKTNPAPSPFSGGAVPSSSLQYKATGPITIDGSSIAAGQQTTIYVDGDALITGNITYAKTYDASNSANVPYFVLIARGNIYLTSNVTQLDGLYVAQPDSSGNGGTFGTCTIGGYCVQQLIVNGSVIAQEVRLLREHGTEGPLASDPNGICAPTGSGNCPPAEIFNFTPAMILGTPNLGPESASYESLFSLPPVF